MTWIGGAANRTVALCQGGSFQASPALTEFGYTLSTNVSCPSGSICNEVREYPVGGTNAKPIINNLTGTTPHYLFSTLNGGGGIRFMNLKLQGAWGGSAGANLAFFIYDNQGIGNPLIHDITIENVDMDSFDIAVDDSVNNTNNLTVEGNHFTNISGLGYLGGSNNLQVSYNSFINSGSDNKFDHALYLASTTPLTNVFIVGNFMSGFSTASGNTICMGSPLISHVAVTNLTVSGNVVVENTAADPGCYGMGFTNTTNATAAIFLKNALFSDNIIVNGGAVGMQIDTCPYCVIENNLVIFQDNAEGAGITTPGDPARPQDDVESYAEIINNTVYYETTSAQGMKGGVVVGAEGTGYIIANNTVMYAGTAHGLNMSNCFTYGLPVASYTFINNNNCYSNDTATQWAFNGTTQYALASWRTASGFEANSSYVNPGWSFSTPLTIPVLDETKTGAQMFSGFFTPAGSPLVGAGSHTYAPTTDITSTTTRSNPPSIGAYE